MEHQKWFNAELFGQDRQVAFCNVMMDNRILSMSQVIS